MKTLLKYTCFLQLVLLGFSSHSQNADINLLRKIYSPNPLPSDGFFRFMGNSVSPMAVGVPCFYMGMSLFQKEKNIRQNIWLQNGIRSGLSIGGAGLISYSLKYTIKRERPFVQYPDIIPKTHPSTWSFPSGHTTFAFATATIVSLNHKKWYITVPMYAWAVTVGYSRMHLGAHFPTDVLGGMIIGTGTSFLVHYLTKKWFSPAPRQTRSDL